jgi:hypothetical protein
VKLPWQQSTHKAAEEEEEGGGGGGRGEAHPSLFFVKIVEIVSLGESRSTTTLNTSTPRCGSCCPLKSPSEVVLYTHRGTKQLQHMSVE